MNINSCIASLIQYALNRKMIEPCDKYFAINQILQCLKLDSYEETAPSTMTLDDILKFILNDAVYRGVCSDDVTSRDRLDTMLMGALTPRPHEVRKQFEELLAQNPQAATDWFY